MATITIANTDWEIADDLRESLAGATTGNPAAAVFAKVAIVGTWDTGRQRDLTDAPMALVCYRTTREQPSNDESKAAIASFDIIVAGQGATESARVQEALRLKNAAINAILITKPANSKDAAGASFGVRRVEFGDPELLDMKQPWAVCRIPANVSFELTSETAH
jgi:hypothetical protein